MERFTAKDPEIIKRNETLLVVVDVQERLFNHIDEHGDGGPLSICTISPGQAGINHSPSVFRIINMDKNGNIETKLRYTPIHKCA